MKLNTRITKCFLSLLVGFLLFLIVRSALYPSTRTSKQPRLAILIPFVGEGPESIPPYLNLFITSAAGSSDLADYFIFHNGVLKHYHPGILPSNVKLIDLQSTEHMVQRYLLRVLSDNPQDLSLNKDFLTKVLTKHISQYPYVLVEFKPALGHIFESFLKSYTHWAYSDLDVVFGDLSSWLTMEELRDYDLVTYGFGDSHRAYLRGQLTIHSNSDKVNQLWRGCEYISKMDQRFDRILKGEAQLHFESAEACYSVQVIKRRSDLKIKFATKAFSDVGMGEDSSVYLYTEKNKSILYTTTNNHHVKGALQIFQQRPMQIEYGPEIPIEWKNDPSENCMYWVRPEYRSELCIHGAGPTDTLFLDHGTLFKQAFENPKLPSGVASAPLFHFQEWKRRYRYNQNAVVLTGMEISQWLFTKEGALPIPQADAGISRASPIDRTKWRGERHQFPPHLYCLVSGLRKVPPVPPAPGCNYLVSWHDPDRVELIHTAKAWSRAHRDDVTLVLTLQITGKLARSTANHLLDIAQANLRAWSGQPAVLVVHVTSGLEEVTGDQMRQRLNQFPGDSCLVALIVQNTEEYASRKALLNMAADVAPTRWILTGVELERGMIFSQETPALCRRRAAIHAHHRGQAWLIPQFAIAADVTETPISLEKLLKWKSEQSEIIKYPSDFEKGSCSDSDHEGLDELFQPIYEAWWCLTLESKGLTMNDNLLFKLANLFHDMEASVIEDGTHRALNEFPIVLVDNLGPYAGILTSTMVREVEEFGGKQCFNGFRLSQLATLGYDLYVLAGAFAASTKLSRSIALRFMNQDILGSSRCDGCIMFEEEHDEILVDILRDERIRVGKAAVVWSDSSTKEQPTS